MRSTLLLVALAAALAVPTVALADGGSTSTTRAAKRLAAKKAQKSKKRHVEQRRSRTGGTVVSVRRTRELEGLVTSLSPLTVTSSGRSTTSSLTCDVPAGVSLTGLQVGDRAELTCTLAGGRWVLRTLERKDGAKAGSQSPTQPSTASCDDDEDDDSGTVGDHDDDCGQLADREEDDREDDD